MGLAWLHELLERKGKKESLHNTGTKAKGVGIGHERNATVQGKICKNI